MTSNDKLRAIIATGLTLIAISFFASIAAIVHEGPFIGTFNKTNNVSCDHSDRESAKVKINESI